MHGPERCANASLIFLDMTVPAWDKDTMKYFSPYPECGGYQQPGQWYIVGGESQIVGPICKSYLHIRSLLSGATLVYVPNEYIHVCSLGMQM